MLAIALKIPVAFTGRKKPDPDLFVWEISDQYVETKVFVNDDDDKYLKQPDNADYFMEIIMLHFIPCHATRKQQ